jgi:hypothetical protein
LIVSEIFSGAICEHGKLPKKFRKKSMVPSAFREMKTKKEALNPVPFNASHIIFNSRCSKLN